MVFTCRGHENITALHKTTLEFTKDKELTSRGDCIVGVAADFSFEELRVLVKSSKKMMIRMRVNDFKENQVAELIEEIEGEVNPAFCDNNEIVIRLGTFPSKRTLLINANKAAKHLNTNFVRCLKNSNCVIRVTLEKIE